MGLSPGDGVHRHEGEAGLVAKNSKQITFNQMSINIIKETEKRTDL